MKYFINYASNGFYNSQREALTIAESFGFECKGYNPSDIDDDFKSKYNNILSVERGAGYWLWKPYIILDYLNKMNDGDFLIYMDSGANLIKDPTYYLENIDSKGILTFSMVQKTSKWTKGDCFFEINKNNVDDYTDVNQIQGTYIFFRKCDYSVSFVKEWLELCTNEHLISDNPNINKNNFSDFIDHRHDQAILSLLVYNKGIEHIAQVDKFCIEHGLGTDRIIVDRHGIRT